MPIKQLHIVGKIKSLFTDVIASKKQTLDRAKAQAEENKIQNKKQEYNDDERVAQATKEFEKSNNKTDGS